MVDLHLFLFIPQTSLTYKIEFFSHTGTILAKREDIAVVIVNSRLGALGYLYDGPDTGNMGLWDNILALQYLHDNLRVFGGDPDKVSRFISSNTPIHSPFRIPH